MKKKLVLTFLMSTLCVLMLTVIAFAKDVDIKINDVNGNSIVVPTVDGEGDPLTWYRVSEKPTEGAYFEYVDGGKAYYIVSVKTKEAAYVNDSYRVCYSYPDLKTGAWSGNIMVANLDGLTHADGTGPEYLNFIFEGTPICYVYIPASILELRGTSGNSLKSLFYGCGNLVGVDIEENSKIEELHGNGFYNCKKLTYIRLPENLKKINAASFVGINPTIVVPKSVTTFELSNWSSPTVQFTGTAADHTGWAYQPSKIEYVNHCDAYYGGEHGGIEDGDCTTALLCERCSKMLKAATDSHNIQKIAKYENGYTRDGYMRTGCINCECYEEITLKPLFTSLGYSASEYGKAGITIGFVVNNEAVTEYKNATGNDLKYGVFAVLQSTLGDNDVFSANGTTIEGCVCVEITNYDFAAFGIKIVGFDEEHMNSKLAMGAYVATTDGEKTEYSYIQGGVPAEGESYHFVSYNDIVSTKDSKSV